MKKITRKDKLGLGSMNNNFYYKNFFVKNKSYISKREQNQYILTDSVGRLLSVSNKPFTDSAVEKIHDTISKYQGCFSGKEVRSSLREVLAELVEAREILKHAHFDLDFIACNDVSTFFDVKAAITSSRRAITSVRKLIKDLKAAETKT